MYSITLVKDGEQTFWTLYDTITESFCLPLFESEEAFNRELQTYKERLIKKGISADEIKTMMGNDQVTMNMAKALELNKRSEHPFPHFEHPSVVDLERSRTTRK